jgi:hypothetical protein
VARTILTINDGTVKFADTQGGLTSATDYKCQVTSAAINSVANDNPVPATFCEGASSVPGKSGWELALAWLQDWNVAGGGLSKYLFDNETLLKWVEIRSTTSSTPYAQGQVYLKAGPFLGEAGGVPAPASVTMGMYAKPTITTP